jgi:YHS domain-containing protein
MRSPLLSALVVAGLALGACASGADPRPVADDPVCRANGDLGCVRVRVDERTPRAVWRGRTFFFCAESCRLEFEKDPARYAGNER